MPNKKSKFVVDTSAFLSLEIINILDKVLEDFNLITTASVIQELNDFAQYGDLLGKTASNILKSKEKLIIKKTEIIERITLIGTTDNELFNLSIKECLPLITDDYKLNHHTRYKITLYFSTFFILFFTNQNKISKKEALEKLERLRDLRNWQNNIVYITSKDDIEKI